AHLPLVGRRAVPVALGEDAEHVRPAVAPARGPDLPEVGRRHRREVGPVLRAVEDGLAREQLVEDSREAGLGGRPRLLVAAHAQSYLERGPFVASACAPCTRPGMSSSTWRCASGPSCAPNRSPRPASPPTSSGSTSASWASRRRARR